MSSGLYISKTPLPNVDCVSSGDYSNPVGFTLSLHDTKFVQETVLTLYVIADNIRVEFFKIEVIGVRMGIELLLSFDNVVWSNNLFYNNSFGEIGSVSQKNFLCKIKYLDDIDVYNAFNITQIKDFKLKLIYN